MWPRNIGLFAPFRPNIEHRAQPLVCLQLADKFHLPMSEVSKIKPDVAEAHNALGNALVQLGKLDAAVNSYGRALDLRPEFAEAQSNLGRALYKQGKLEEAEAAYRRAIAIAPHYAKAHARLGTILWDSNRIKESFQSITRSAELSYSAPVRSVPNNEPILP